METTWTGSESERKPQGLCLPPSKPSDLREKWTIPAGTTVKVQPVNNFRQPWRWHTTQKELGFRKCEGLQNGWGKFRQEGYFIRVEWKHVVRRE